MAPARSGATVKEEGNSCLTSCETKIPFEIQFTFWALKLVDYNSSCLITVSLKWGFCLGKTGNKEGE